MAWYPGAERRPLGKQTEPRMTEHNILCFHTMVGSLMGTDNYFDDGGYYGTESHFGVGGSSDGARDGHVIQWQDTDFGADANLDGKGEVISIETSDGGDPSRPWSPKQIDSLVELGIWVCQEYGIPPVLIPDTKPGRRGIGYHRQGCDHSSSYRPRGWPYDAWRVPGGRRWSRSLGKTCPGDVRIRQLVDIVIPRIQAGLNPPKHSGDDVASIKSFRPTFDADGNLYTETHPFVLPVGSKSRVTSEAWISFMCNSASGGAAEYVRLMSIAAGARTLADETFTDVGAGRTRPSLKAADGQDEFCVFVRSAIPYSICIEMDPK